MVRAEQRDADWRRARLTRTHAHRAGSLQPLIPSGRRPSGSVLRPSGARSSRQRRSRCHWALGDGVPIWSNTVRVWSWTGTELPRAESSCGQGTDWPARWRYRPWAPSIAGPEHGWPPRTTGQPHRHGAITGRADASCPCRSARRRSPVWRCTALRNRSSR